MLSIVFSTKKQSPIMHENSQLSILALFFACFEDLICDEEHTKFGTTAIRVE